MLKSKSPAGWNSMCWLQDKKATVDRQAGVGSRFLYFCVSSSRVWVRKSTAEETAAGCHGASPARALVLGNRQLSSASPALHTEAGKPSPGTSSTLAHVATKRNGEDPYNLERQKI